MSYSDPRHCHHQRVTQWLAAMRQHAAWLYAADEQYLYLVAEANELYQCGVVGLQDRHDMVTDALGMYGWAIEHCITRETHYCADCCYDVLDAGNVVGTVNSEGIYHEPAPGRQRLGFLPGGAPRQREHQPQHLHHLHLSAAPAGNRCTCSLSPRLQLHSPSSLSMTASAAAH